MLTPPRGVGVLLDSGLGTARTPSDPGPAVHSAVSDVSTRGLIPQLSDLLYALTDCHELLLRKVRGVREEMEGADRSVLNHSTTFVHQTPFIQSHGSADSRLHALVDKMGPRHTVPITRS